MRSAIRRSIGLSATLVSMLAACASAPRSNPEAVTTTTQAVTSAADPQAQGDAARCEIVCEGAQVTRVTTDTPDYHARAVSNANEVLASLHGGMRACYEKRLRVDPTAHAYLEIDVVIGPDGRVWTVDTTGGARLGKDGVACIVEQVRAAVFEPVAGGGTRRIRVPFAFRRVGGGEAI